MTDSLPNTKKKFKGKVRRPALSAGETPWAFIILPKKTSDILPRRGRASVDGTLNGKAFRATLEPDGQLSHWLRVDMDLLQAAGAEVGDLVTIELVPVDQEPEPEIPPDLQNALSTAPEARAVWEDTTTIARLDWIHWVTSAKQSKTRAKRIDTACDMLASGKRRVCCFDPSGFYSKAFRAPEEAD